MQPSDRGAILRAAQYEIPLPQTEDVRTLDPDIALKASSGRLLGFSQAASGYVLALGFGNNALVSSDADLGGYFYEHQSGMEEISVSDDDGYPRAVASDAALQSTVPIAAEVRVGTPGQCRSRNSATAAETSPPGETRSATTSHDEEAGARL